MLLIGSGVGKDVQERNVVSLNTGCPQFISRSCCKALLGDCLQPGMYFPLKARLDVVLRPPEQLGKMIGPIIQQNRIIQHDG